MMPAKKETHGVDERIEHNHPCQKIPKHINHFIVGAFFFKVHFPFQYFQQFHG
jgi:hypothetical protein